MTTALGTAASSQSNGNLDVHANDLQTARFHDQGVSVFRRYLKSIDWRLDSIAAQRFHLRSLVVEPIRTTSALEQPARVQSSSEMRWLAENAAKIEAEYRGQWLLLNGDELLSHSQNFADIRRRIAESGIQSPFIYFVPEEGNLEFIS